MRTVPGMIEATQIQLAILTISSTRFIGNTYRDETGRHDTFCSKYQMTDYNPTAILNRTFIGDIVQFSFFIVRFFYTLNVFRFHTARLE